MSRKALLPRIRCNILKRDNYTCQICGFHKIYTTNDVPKQYKRDFWTFVTFKSRIANNPIFDVLKYIDPGSDIDNITLEWLSPAHLEIDHIIPVCKGGSDDDSNLRCLCDDCHREKTNIDLYNKKAGRMEEKRWNSLN